MFTKQLFVVPKKCCDEKKFIKTTGNRFGPVICMMQTFITIKKVYESTVEYPCEKSKVQSPKRQNKFETNQQTKPKQNK